MRPTVALILPILLAPAWPTAASEPVLERVLLTTGGVGYLGYRAEPDADGAVRLRVPLRQVDDILKSLTVMGEGQVGPMSLRGPAPLADSFQDAPFGEADLASLPQLLLRLRGAEVEVTGPVRLRGRILAVAPEETVEGEARTVRHRLSLLTDAGIRPVLLESIEQVTPTDPKLRQQLERVLGRLGERQMEQERELTFRLTGSPGRPVAFGHLAEMPLWKASYRLVAAADQGLLQGWAVLENLSGQDWREVEVTLVAGSPTALRQALFQTYFVPRPEVPVVPDAEPSPLAEASMAAMAPRAKAAEALAEPAALDRATPQELTAQTLFRLPGRVSLATGHTVMAPLVDLRLPVERIAIYRMDLDGGHPRAGLRLRQAGTTSLPAGIATLFERLDDGGLTFLGDATLPQMAPGAEQLVGYGLDRNIEIDRREDSSSRIDRVRIVDGVLELARVNRQRVTLAVAARFAGPARELVVEQPLAANWRPAGPPDAMVEQGMVRVQRRLEPQSRLEVALDTEQTTAERIELLADDPERLLLLFSGAEAPAEIRPALERLRALSARLADIERRIATVETRRADRLAEQERLRANLEAVPGDSDLARRYLDRLGGSEDELSAIGRELDGLRAERDVAEQERRDFLRSLRV